MRQDVCVGVRDRRSGRWEMAHAALRRRVAGAVRLFPNGACVPQGKEPFIGEALYFELEQVDSRQLVTSRVEQIRRSEREELIAYVPLCA